jgi:hypothetical protein
MSFFQVRHAGAQRRDVTTSLVRRFAISLEAPERETIRVMWSPPPQAQPCQQNYG